MERNDPMPQPVFTKEELTFLQDLFDAERAAWFNYKMELTDAESIEEADQKYKLCKAIRNKVYHLGGRDTLALGTHEQRHWDQRHDY